MGDEETYELMEFIHSEVKAELNMNTNIFMTKDDKLDLIDQAKVDKIDLIERMKVDKIDLIEQMKVDKINLIEQARMDKIDLIDRMNKNKTETLVWIVGVGILQFLMIFLSKMLR